MANAVDYSALTALIRSLADAPEDLKSLRLNAHETLSETMLAKVQESIGGTGTVQSWQEAYVGSGGGYAAVRAKAKTYTEKNSAGKTYAVGRVTNAIESGHVNQKGAYIPNLSGHRPNGQATASGAKLVYNNVKGRGFYADARGQLQSIAQEAAVKLADEIASELEKLV